MWKFVYTFVMLLVLHITVPAHAACPVGEWIDPDTPANACTGMRDLKGRELELVFSDEFEVPGRTFTDGHDPLWTALVNFPNTNSQVNAYSDLPEFATTANGKLKLKAAHRRTTINYFGADGLRKEESRVYTTQMLQGWNKFCFTEGLVEVKVKLVGRATQSGLWPAAWIFGNLGRATFKESTDYLWPWSFDHCPDAEDEEACQNPRMMQRINACQGPEETAKYGLNPHQGRGATEIDLIEAMPGTLKYDYSWKVDAGHCAPDVSDEVMRKWLAPAQPFVATSVQLGPGIALWADERPLEVWGGDAANCYPADWEKMWYSELEPGSVAGSNTYGTAYASTLNLDFYGEFFEGYIRTDAISALNELPHASYDSFHTHSIDYDTGPDGYAYFAHDGLKQFYVDGRNVQRDKPLHKDGVPAGTMKGRKIPEEPSYLILNIDLSTRWGWPPCDERWGCECCIDCSNQTCTNCWINGENKMAWLAALCADLPGEYEVEYVRVYQRVGHTRIGCNPRDFPTEGWINSNQPEFTSNFHPELLRYVFAGGSECTADADCGSFAGVARGTCSPVGLCECQGSWTGPKCRSRRLSHSITCRPLEDVVVGGGQCFASQSGACGHGACVRIAMDPNAPWADTASADGASAALGGGDGRCRCSPGYSGPYCTQATAPRCPANPMPPHFETGMGLEKWIAELCGQRTLGPALTAACAEVQWTPHWVETGGQYSGCGAWLRATWVGLANCEDLRGTPATASCTDGARNGDEAGVDCGGALCPPCLAACDVYERLSSCGERMRSVAGSLGQLPAVDASACSIQSYVHATEGACPPCSCPRATNEAALPEVCETDYAHYPECQGALEYMWASYALPAFAELNLEPTLCSLQGYLHTQTKCPPCACARPSRWWCRANQHVQGGRCLWCPAGTSRPGGDDSWGPDTQCIPGGASDAASPPGPERSPKPGPSPERSPSLDSPPQASPGGTSTPNETRPERSPEPSPATSSDPTHAPPASVRPASPPGLCPLDYTGYPECKSRMDWLHAYWNVGGRYTSAGVDGTACSMQRYLYQEGGWCPPCNCRGASPSEAPNISSSPASSWSSSPSPSPSSSPSPSPSPSLSPSPRPVANLSSPKPSTQTVTSDEVIDGFKEIFDDLTYASPGTTTIHGALVHSRGSIVYTAHRAYAGTGTLHFRAGAALTVSSGVVLTSGVVTRFEGSKMSVAGMLKLLAQIQMSSADVWLGSESSLLHVSATAHVQGTQVSGAGGTVYSGTAGSALTSKDNTWLPAVERLEVASSGRRATLRSATTTVELCASQHGRLTIPSGMTLAAFLNCTLHSNDAYSSAASALTFAGGSYLVLESVTNTSRPLFMGKMTVLSDIEAKALVTDTQSINVTLASYTPTGSCTVPFVFTLEGCPSGAACAVVAQEDSGFCHIMYSQVVPGTNTETSWAAAQSAPNFVMLIAIGVGALVLCVCCAYPLCLCIKRRRPLRQAGKAHNELANSGGTSFSGSGDRAPPGRGGSLLFERDEEPLGDSFCPLVDSGELKCAAPLPGDSDDDLEALQWGVGKPSHASYMPSEPGPGGGPDCADVPPPTPAHVMRRTDSAMRQLGRQLSRQDSVASGASVLGTPSTCRTAEHSGLTDGTSAPKLEIEVPRSGGSGTTASGTPPSDTPLGGTLLRPAPPATPANWMQDAGKQISLALKGQGEAEAQNLGVWDPTPSHHTALPDHPSLGDDDGTALEIDRGEVVALGAILSDTPLGSSVQGTPCGGTVQDTPLGGTVQDTPRGGTLGGTVESPRSRLAPPATPANWMQDAGKQISLALKGQGEAEAQQLGVWTPTPLHQGVLPDHCIGDHVDAEVPGASGRDLVMTVGTLPGDTPFSGTVQGTAESTPLGGTVQDTPRGGTWGGTVESIQSRLAPPATPANWMQDAGKQISLALKGQGEGEAQQLGVWTPTPLHQGVPPDHCIGDDDG